MNNNNNNAETYYPAKIKFTTVEKWKKGKNQKPTKTVLI